LQEPENFSIIIGKVPIQTRKTQNIYEKPVILAKTNQGTSAKINTAKQTATKRENILNIHLLRISPLPKELIKRPILNLTIFL
jgi:hypothetical protein